MALPPALALVRIGRHDDNDIRLDQSTVHRHHALIHRTPTADFIITDVSGQAGNGVVVNGQRLAETRLKSGDTIYLGEAALIFESTLPAYLSQHLPVTVTEASTPKTTTSRIITSPIITAQPTTSPVSQTPSHGR
jgi:pSer/pThr/pTyr-binding forkhead associated (FHA) protein